MIRTRLITGLLCAALIMFAGFAMAEQDTAWTDLSAELDGVLYKLPFEMSVLVQDGWTTDDAELVLEPSSYTLSRIKKGDEVAYACIINVGINDAVASDCLVGGLSLDDYDAKKGATLKVAGITLGDSRDTLLAAWGQPSSDSGRTLSYDLDYYEGIDVTVDADTGLITDIDVRNFTAPAGYNDEAYAAPVETPECVTGYQPPEAIGDDWLSFTFTLNGVLYRMPVPVAVMAEDGWKLKGDADAPKLAAHQSDYGWKLQNGAQALESVRVANPTATANTWENAMVTSFRVSGYEPVDIGLPNGITLSSKMADIEAALEGKEFTKEESGKYIYYEMKLSYGNSVNVSVNSEEDMVVSISIDCDGSEAK